MNESYIEWKGWSDAEFGRFRLEDAIYYSKELALSGISSVNGLKVGELGYGNGTFAGWVREQGGRWVGQEILPDLQRRAHEAGFDVVSQDQHFSSTWGVGTLDLIVAFDVIEHLDLGAIRVFLAEAKEALKPGGIVLIRIPSGDSPFSGAIYRGDVTHRTLLGSNAVSQLAKEVQFELCQIRSPALPVWGLGLIRGSRRLAIRAVQTVAFPLIRYALMGEGTAVVSPNMLIVLRKNS